MIPVPEVALCYAAADSAAAGELSDYLQRNLDMRVEPVPLSPWLDLIEAIESVQDASNIIALLSPASVPERWPRERWDAIRCPHLAWYMLAGCPFPALLRRGPFAAAKPDEIDAFRLFRRWILTRKCDAPAARLKQSDLAAFLDRPGCVTLDDDSIVHELSRYFSTTVTIDTRSRSLTSLASEMAAALGLDRSGDRDSLVDSVQRSCRSHRNLLLVRGPGIDWLDNPGRTSVAFLPAGEPPAIVSPERMLVTLVACQKGRAEPPSAAGLDRTLAAGFASCEWTVIRELAHASYTYWKNEYRLAEAYDLLDSLRRAAQFYGDLDVLNECIVEQSWIGERWSSRLILPDPADCRQLAFGW